MNSMLSSNHRLSLVWLSISLFVCVHSGRSMAQSASPVTFGSPYVVVDAHSQLHSKQLFGQTASSLLDQVDAQVTRTSGRLVKLHVVGIDEAAIASMAEEIQRRYGERAPAVTCVVGNMAEAESKLGVDCVIDLGANKSKAGSRVDEDEWGRVLHPGCRVYISGQAEKADSPEEATARTLDSLKRTLESFGASIDDVVQVKAFLTPMSASSRVNEVFRKFAGTRNIPLVLVHWESTLPIEIELVAAAPADSQPEPVQYRGALNMTNSPVYCRVARVHSPKTIYIGGLYAQGNGIASELAADVEVKDIFQSLSKILAKLAAISNIWSRQPITLPRMRPVLS